MNAKATLAVRPIREALVGLPRLAKSTIAVSADLVGFAVCAIAALWLVYLSPYVVPSLVIVAGTSLMSVLLGAWQGMYRSVVRYMGFDLFLSGARTALGSAVVGAAMMQLFVFGATPYRWATAYAAFSFIYICGSRVLARRLLVEKRAHEQRERVVIYGAGSAGAQLAASLLAGDDYVPVAMVDDDPKLLGKKVCGLEVYRPRDIETLCRRHGADRILLAVPSAKHSIRRRILERLSEFPVHVQTVPGVGDIVSGKARVDDIEDVDVNDLLGRDPVPADPELLSACIAGKSVLVTGAGGSIGSELCRQIIALQPKRLVLFEISEPALYQIDKHLRDLGQRLGGDCEIVPLLGSVGNEKRMLDVIRTFGIQTVYHAAAYKHVPLVEQNLFDGIDNNIFGTRCAARAAVEGGVESFVLISSDKAVNPTSVMGATKRFAELILQAENARGGNTRFSMVRFGNVLESSGSVVPLFREQIRKGGPVTVTHPAIIRYFMTIPEAAELVIQAGSMATGGDVFVLDMGEPVRIHDLAHRMVNLMGLTVRDEANPDGDIPIEYIGLRPAEKLFEELLIGWNVKATDHARILRADEDFLPPERLERVVADLERAAQALDCERARGILEHAVREYSPVNGIDDLAWLEKARSDDYARPDTVVEFPLPKVSS